LEKILFFVSQELRHENKENPEGKKCTNLIPGTLNSQVLIKELLAKCMPKFTLQFSINMFSFILCSTENEEHLDWGMRSIQYWTNVHLMSRSRGDIEPSLSANRHP
jgi:hypothetical protein